MSNDEYGLAIGKYRSSLKSIGEIKTLKMPLQEDCQFIRLKGIILMKQERVALFENNEQTGFSARK
jgi:hypothetical protein